jgi:hypothetical protein
MAGAAEPSGVEASRATTSTADAMQAQAIEEISAYVLRAEELKVGPTAIRYGIIGQFQIGSNFGLNLFGAINGDIKWQVFQSEVVTIGIDAGVIHFDPSFVGIDETFSVTAFPVGVAVSFSVHPDFHIHPRLRAFLGAPDGNAPDSVLRIQRFVGPVGKVAAELNLEWRMTPHLALVGEFAVPVVEHDDAYFYASEDPSDLVGQLRTALSLMVGYESFRLRAGVGYGPSFLGEVSVFPVLDMYFRLF